MQNKIKSKKIEEADQAVKNGEYQKAVKVLQNLIKNDPKDADVHLRLGNLLLYSQSQKKALDHLVQAVALAPDDIKTWKTLIHYYIKNNEYARAIEVSLKALDRLKDEGIEKKLLELYNAEGRQQELSNLAKKLYDNNPTDPSIIALIANVMYDNDLKYDTLTLYQKLVLGYNEYMDNKDWHRWLVLMDEANRLNEASEIIDKNIQNDPSNIDMIVLYVEALILSNEYEKAIAYAKSVQKKDPDNSRPFYQLKRIYGILGKREEADSYTKEILDKDPNNIKALYSYIEEDTVSYGDDRYRRLCYAAATYGSLKEENKIILHFAMAKAYSDIGDLPTAFVHYRQAGILKLKNGKVTDEKAAFLLKLFKNHLSKEVIEQYKSSTHSSSEPIFIIGMPRSGTTLLESILSSLDGVYGAGELPYAMSAVINLGLGEDSNAKTSHFNPWDEGYNPTMYERGEYYLKNARKHVPDNALKIIDKMPGNTHIAGLLHAMFPQGHIIYARRHPVEICLSAYRILFSQEHTWSYDLRLAAKYTRQIWENIDYWKSILPEGAILDVFYENVIDDLEGESRRIADHLGVAWNPSCLEFHKSKQAVKTASQKQVRQPLYRSSVDRWKKYAPYLKPLLDEIPDLIERYERELEESRSMRNENN